MRPYMALEEEWWIDKEPREHRTMGNVKTRCSRAALQSLGACFKIRMASWIIRDSRKNQKESQRDQAKVKELGDLSQLF